MSEGKSLCPHWCTDHHDDDHRTAGENIMLSGGEDAHAWTRAIQNPAYDDKPAVWVGAWARSLPDDQGAAVRLRTANDAAQLALLLDRLATATPKQMRTLAAQVRAAAVAFTTPETEETDG